MLIKIKHKCGIAYWKIVAYLEKIQYRTKKYLKSLYIWLCGIGNSEKVGGQNDAKVLVVCAHPDDETIFFSTVLKQEKPFVICMSHTGNKVRSKEFENALDHQGVQGILLNMPDVPGMKWGWKLFACLKLKGMKKCFPNVEKVYTHAGSGESRHPHHFMTHDAVVKAFCGCKIYTTAVELPSGEYGKLPEKDVAEKMSIIRNMYSTQVNMLVRWCGWFDAYLHYEVLEEEK